MGKYSQILYEIKTGNITKVVDFIKLHVNFQYKFLHFGDTALLIASKYGHL